MKILVPVDGSQASEHAVRELLKYIPMLRDKPSVELLFVHLPIRPPPTIHGVSIDTITIDKYYEREAKDATVGVKELLQRENIEFQTNTAVGDPSEQVCKVAKEKGCDMIWMGTRGMGGFANLILGSVATKVLHRAHIPVVLVPAMQH
jgi:nucleotide-binding universal stress UspA family protein